LEYYLLSRNRHILVANNDTFILETLLSHLEAQGFVVSHACCDQDVLSAVNKAYCDLIILDVVSSDEDSFALCQNIRKISDIPIIFLSERCEDTDRIIGLELGADDYINKPYNPRELVARIRSVLRRTNTVIFAQQGLKVSPPKFGGWLLDVTNQTIISDSGDIKSLSTGETRLLQIFCDHPNTTLSRDQLLAWTQGRKANAFDRSIDNYISRIRKKIEQDPHNPRLLKTYWGSGYALTCDP
jgi:two-component system OmpR family response regulator